MSSFTSELVVSLISGGKKWRLFRSFTYRIGKKYSRRFIKVARGFETDFASIPKFLWFLPYWAKYNKSAPLHDWLYKVKQVMGKPITRKEADDIWLEAMLIDFRHHKSGRLVAMVEYLAVRMFGIMAWRLRDGTSK